jgi:arylsulfatase A-like enzyme
MKTLVRLFWLLAIGVACILPARAAGTSAARPNFLFILTDDQRFDAMGCAGNPIIQTPQMDALAREGIRFRNMFVTSPICAASRASIFTGLYERTHRYTFGTYPIAARQVASSYPALLKQAGYRTGFVGKFGVAVPPGATQKMFDSFVPLTRTPYLKKLPDGSVRHLTDLEGDKAVEFLRTCRPGSPFCLSVSFNAPHAEDDDPRQYIWSSASDGLYADAIFPVPLTMTNGFFESLPAFLRNTESRVRFHWRFDEPQKYQNMVRGYFRMITDVDRVVGRLRATLREGGLETNTIIFYTSDNGYFLGERGFADKWYLYEYSLRVPLLVFDPRATAPRRGSLCDLMALNLDLAPTLLDLAGVRRPRAMQGRSLRPLLEGAQPANWRTEFFAEHLMEADGIHFGKVVIPKSEGVRTERFTYLRWFEQQPPVEELYDHQADFEEVNNLRDDPAQASLLKDLRQRTTRLRDRYGGPFKSNFKPKPVK